MKRREKRVAIVGSLVVGLCLSGVGGYAVKQYLDRKGACEAVQALVQQNGEVVKTSSGSPVVGILGDSYLMGDGLADRTDGWAYHIGKSRGWSTRADGISSTGYTNGGFCGGQTYFDRVGALLAVHPQILIIEGGLNDWQATKADIGAAASKTIGAFSKVRRVIVIGPVNAPSRKERLPDVDSALKEAAESHGAEYISALGWNLEFLPDNLHLTAAGHARFAELVSEKISAS